MYRLNTPLQCKTKAEMIYGMLREVIVSGELPPGERIVLRKVASDLGVSTIPVREAIKFLEAEGLVDVSAHSEVTVSSLSIKDFRELSSIRVLLESHAVRLATERLTQELVEELLNQIDEMEKGVAEGREYGILNRQFHQTIYNHCGNDHLIKIINELTAKTDRARALFTIHPRRHKDSIEEHKVIVQAMVDGEAEKAEKLHYKHNWAGLEIFLNHYGGKE